MTQELKFGGHNSEPALSSEMTVISASIADPYVLLTMSDGSVQLLVGGIQLLFKSYAKTFIFFVKKLSDICLVPVYMWKQ